jgi:4-nitrophenyl phosphatase
MSAKKFRALLLDMDGVLWRDNEAIGDLPAIFEKIADMGMQVAFVTNNATRTAEQYLSKFENFGVEVKVEQIYSSALASAEYLSKVHPGGGMVFVVGERGLQKALEERGFQHGEEDCLAVVVGLDREINYEKLTRATLLVNSGVRLIGTNPDKTLPTPEGMAPGAGSIIAAIESASGKSAKIIGKPEATLLEAAIAKLEFAASEVLMVGDRLETDIAAGQNAGCATALVLSGASSLDQAKLWKPAPDYIEADLNSLMDVL